DLVDHAVLFGLLSIHIEVSVKVAANSLRVLSGVLGEDISQQVVDAQRLASLDLDVGRLAPRATHDLVHVDRRVRHGVALPGRARAQQHGRHAGAKADTVAGDVTAIEAHRVVDREAGVDAATRGVDVEADVAFGVFPLEV